MKHLIILTTIVLFGSSATVLAQNTPEDATKAQETSDAIEEMTCQIDGMTCQGCVQAVEATLNKVDGVEKYEVSLAKGEATIKYDPTKVNKKQIKKELDKTPFTITDKKPESKSPEKNK